MSQQLQIRSPEKRLLASPSPQSVPSRSFRGELPSPILQLQRMLGNQQVAQLIKTKRLTPDGKIIGLQPKLTVGAADDQYEQEADQVARQVMCMPEAGSTGVMQPEILPEEEKDQALQTKPLSASITRFVQRETVNEEPEDKEKLVQARFLNEAGSESLQRQPETEEDKKTPIQTQSAGPMSGSFEAEDDVESRINASKNGGSPLPDSVRAYMEPRFGVDFNHVRVHTGSDAMQMNRDVGAQAFTHGSDIYFGEGRSPSNLELTAHELTHVIQQTGAMPLQVKKQEGKIAPFGSESAIKRTCAACTAGDAASNSVTPKLPRRRRAASLPSQPGNGNHDVHRLLALKKNGNAGRAGAISSKPGGNNDRLPAIQRRLVTFGTLPDVNALLGLLGPQAGLTLALNVANNQAQINAVLPAPPPSPTLRNRLTTIINHATQHAEIIVARGQPQVFVGAFPQPSDLTVTRTQQVDIDDILAIEAGAPGNGVAVAIHEIEENFQAHGTVPVAGTDRFAAAHERATTLAENPVAAELVGPGRRVALVQVPGTIVPSFVLPFVGPIPGFINPVANTTAAFFDYENYFLGITSRFVAATQDSQIVNAQRFPQTVVSTRTIDNFASGSNALPAGSAAITAAAAADVAANPTATVHIQGFTDDTGSAAVNLTVSGSRATSVQGGLQAAGVGQGRMHAEGLGATNFLNANANAAERAANRRVVITVVRPQL